MKHNFEEYCKDYKNIENYDEAAADNFKGWHCHHRRGIDIPTEKLKALGMYYNRPAEELIFLTRSEHRALHTEGEKHPMYGKHQSEETKKKMSEAHKGKHHSDEARKKIAEAHKGKHHSDEARKKIAEALKGKPSGNKGKHFSEESKKKLSEAKKGNTTNRGKHWFNNGKINKFCYECPDGFIPGRL